MTREQQSGSFNRLYYSMLSDKSNQEWREFYLERVSEILKYVARGADHVAICDVGCGLGEFLKLGDTRGWSTFGIDKSEYAIREAQKRTKATLAVFDICDGIPFVKPLDAITCFDVVEHLDKPESAIVAISKGLRVRGILLLTTPNARFEFYRKVLRWSSDDTHISIKRQREWERILLNMGFEVLRSETIFPVLSRKKGSKALLAKMAARIGYGSTLYIVARKLTWTNTSNGKSLANYRLCQSSHNKTTGD